jgi:hypothetical protein
MFLARGPRITYPKTSRKSWSKVLQLLPARSQMIARDTAVARGIGRMPTFVYTRTVL